MINQVVFHSVEGVDNSTNILYFCLVFRDFNTPNPFMEKVPDWAEEDKAVLKPNHVHMDTVTMGLGCGCLQVQSRSAKHQRALCAEITGLSRISRSFLFKNFRFELVRSHAVCMYSKKHANKSLFFHMLCMSNK